MIRKTFIETERGLVARVTFILPNSIWADANYLVGDFNEWNHSSHPFQRGREGTWVVLATQLGTSVLAFGVSRLIKRAFLSKCTTEKYNHYGSECIDFLPFCLF